VLEEPSCGDEVDRVELVENVIRSILSDGCRLYMYFEFGGEPKTMKHEPCFSLFGKEESSNDR
jgi:hypothetical protein